jgi:hypothetical protein
MNYIDARGWDIAADSDESVTYTVTTATTCYVEDLGNATRPIFGLLWHVDPRLVYYVIG